MLALSTIEEKRLLLALKQGNNKSFERLYAAYSPSLYWKLLKMIKVKEEADEILQDLFVKVWDRRSQIDTEQSFSAYLYKIAQRMVFDHYRKIARANKAYEQIQYDSTEIIPDVEDYIFAKETSSLIKQAVDEMPPQRKLAFQLCKIEGKSHQQAAEIMNISPNTVHNHLVLALKSIRLYLEKEQNIAPPVALLCALFLG